MFRAGAIRDRSRDAPHTRRAPSPRWPPVGTGVGVRGRVTLERPLPPHPTCFASRPRIKSGAGSLPGGERWSKRHRIASAQAQRVSHRRGAHRRQRVIVVRPKEVQDEKGRHVIGTARPTIVSHDRLREDDAEPASRGATRY